MLHICNTDIYNSYLTENKVCHSELLIRNRFEFQFQRTCRAERSRSTVMLSRESEKIGFQYKRHVSPSGVEDSCRISEVN